MRQGLNRAGIAAADPEVECRPRPLSTEVMVAERVFLVRGLGVENEISQQSQMNRKLAAPWASSPRGGKEWVVSGPIHGR